MRPGDRTLDPVDELKCENETEEQNDDYLQRRRQKGQPDGDVRKSVREGSALHLLEESYLGSDPTRLWDYLPRHFRRGLT